MINLAQFKEFTADRQFDCSQCKQSVDPGDKSYWYKAVTNKTGNNTRVCESCAKRISTQATMIELSPETINNLEKLMKSVIDKPRVQFEPFNAKEPAITSRLDAIESRLDVIEEALGIS